METIELYSCEELWDFFIDLLENYRDFLKDEDVKKLREKKDTLVVYSDKIYERDAIKYNLSYQDFYQIYDSCKALFITKNNDTFLYSSKTMEIPVYFSREITRHFAFFRSIKREVNDEKNNITYIIDKASADYSILILNYLYKNKQLLQNYRRRMFTISSSRRQKDQNTLKVDTLLNELHHIFSLKVITKKDQNSEDFIRLSNAFFFEFMLKENKEIHYYLNSFDMLDLDTSKRLIRRNEGISDPPKRIYNEYILDYYRLAVSSSEAFSQYISYYHVLEFFFDKKFKENLRKEFQDKITSPNFSYKKGKDLDSVIKFIKDKTKNSKEDGQGNELESLKLVLKEMINLSELKEHLNPEQIKYFQQHKIEFSNATTVSFEDKDNFHIHLAKRIYQTRNALVHSKDNGKERYKPYQDNKELSKEIPLIKLVAEQIIINSSTPL